MCEAGNTCVQFHFRSFMMCMSSAYACRLVLTTVRLTRTQISA